MLLPLFLLFKVICSFRVRRVRQKKGGGGERRASSTRNEASQSRLLCRGCHCSVQNIPPRKTAKSPPKREKRLLHGFTLNIRKSHSQAGQTLANFITCLNPSEFHCFLVRVSSSSFVPSWIYQLNSKPPTPPPHTHTNILYSVFFERIF